MDVWTGIVAIVAVVSGARLARAWIERGKGGDNNGGALERRLDQTESEIGRLRERVVTLERIVTDSSSELDREIRGLRDQPPRSDNG